MLTQLLNLEGCQYGEGDIPKVRMNSYDFFWTENSYLGSGGWFYFCLFAA